MNIDSGIHRRFFYVPMHKLKDFSCKTNCLLLIRQEIAISIFLSSLRPDISINFHLRIDKLRQWSFNKIILRMVKREEENLFQLYQHEIELFANQQQLRASTMTMVWLQSFLVLASRTWDIDEKKFSILINLIK